MSRKSFEVLWSEAAIRDLERIVDFLAQEAPAAAERLFADIVERSTTLESPPLRGRIVPDLARFEISIFRELVVPPYRLLYRIDADHVFVVAFFDARRNLEDILLSRFTGP